MRKILQKKEKTPSLEIQQTDLSVKPETVQVAEEKVVSLALNPCPNCKKECDIINENENLITFRCQSCSYEFNSPKR